VLVFAISNATLSDISLRCFRRADDFEILVVDETVDKVLLGALSLVLEIILKFLNSKSENNP
jgi:hypothetical protein